MQPPAIVRIAEFYLLLSSVVYAAMGLGSLGALLPPGHPLGAITEALSYFKFVATAFGLTPLRFTLLASLPNISLLGFVALVLSVLGVVALWKVKKSSSWLYVWYVISVLAVLMVVDNTLLVLRHAFTLRIIVGIAHAALVILATFQLSRYWNRKENPVIS